MNNVKFTASIRKFRDESEGAACFYDAVREKHFCANRLTKKQAEEFADKNDLELKSWRPGKSCSEIKCG